MTFNKETDFEHALIEVLFQKGWETEVLKNATEKQLLQNWANILFENNRGIDRLNGCPLTDSEMQQILEQIMVLRTPLRLNSFINGKSVSITRDNSDDTLHCGKEISLKIYDRHEIAAGQSRYQIVQQPKFPTASPILNDRRGDLMLLINGMPVFHLELKKSGIPISQACHQIEKYSHEGIFSGLFSLVQIFVAMTPEETVYFANAGTDGKFNSDYYFHWADFNNEPINHWKDIASSLLSIPMAHQLIGFYTVADNSDGVLKVMRSYQYYAAHAISDRVATLKWDAANLRGGYIWHTTGSGKTLTSFKSAQLIANSKDADKVIFLMDRIELGTQSLKEYRNFADDNESVQATENTNILITKLKSHNPADTLIVTSIQKMSNIKDEEDGLNAHDIQSMNAKRIVFILDEAHRSTFGDMLITIKQTFPSAIFFGFTGTPIQEENQRKMNTTATVFGDELHRYSIADGIRDKNVLGFDPYRVSTFKDKDLREVVALAEAKANSLEEVFQSEKKSKIYDHVMNQVKMAGHYDTANEYVKGIEDYVPTAQYQTPQHQNKVIEDILEHWMTLSRGNKFHAIFATSSIHEAIGYYRHLKKAKPELKVTALFDPNIDNEAGFVFKEDGLVEIIKDYNTQYEQDFSLATHARFKKDIANRLAHKEQYKLIERFPEKQLDLLIVVDQMLTGFDSKWINTLYLDKILRYENIIQAFSRTNRLFGNDKPFGTIRYYRKPHTMQRNIEMAVQLYSGDRAFGLFVENLERNLNQINYFFAEISYLFHNAKINDFENLPTEKEACGKFAKLFKQLTDHLEAAKIQGFVWDKLTYHFEHENEPATSVILAFNEQTYLILALRYKELFTSGSGGGGGSEPYDIEGYLTEIDTGRIDSDYMNSRFDKYLKLLNDGESQNLQEALDELHKTFASLSQEEQKFANIFLHDIQRGNVQVEAGKTLRDYITEYQCTAKDDRIHNVAEMLGLDETKLRQLMSAQVNDSNINEFGRFDELKSDVNKDKAKQYFEKLEGQSIPLFKVNVKVDKFLREFVMSDGTDLEEADTA